MAPARGEASFDLRTVDGLSEEEAARRLRDEGPNELPAEKRRSVWCTAREVVAQPMLLLLLAAGVLYLILGDAAEALTLLSFVLVIIGIALYQERKTERALGALRDLTSPRALVIRGGAEHRVAGREVVRGDVVVLVEGDRVPADAELLDAWNLSVDESLLTGESAPVRKRCGVGAGGSTPRPPGGDDSPLVYSGTLVVGGRGVAEVRSTGARTELGRIGAGLQGGTEKRSHLEREVDRIVRVLAAGGLGLCALLVAFWGIARGAWIHGLLSGITLAMAVLPEEFPVVLTVFLALGAFRISKRNVLTRRVAAVEALGSATVVCTDKTGTLTQNRMAIRRLWASGSTLDVDEASAAQLPEAFHELVEYGILASQADPFDPMEVAFHALGRQKLAGTEHLHASWTLEREYPLSPDLLALSHVWRAPEGGRFVVAAKGAPEAIADLCHLGAGSTAALLEDVRVMAADGLRVLAVARAPKDAEPRLPDQQHDFAFELVGLVGLADPIRAEVPASVAECYAAGIRVVMITGDHLETARSVARAARIRDGGGEGALTGPEIEVMSDEALGRRLAGLSIVARALPAHKLRLVRALSARGEVVAMTGDGVNDAPALQAADIGIAMGKRGTDVAREASSLVLSDDDFSSIIAAVRLGRRITDNLRKAMAYIVAVHIPIAGVSLLPVLLGWPTVLFPVHVVFLELVIDPACSVAFEAEAEEADVMRRPPRPRDAQLLGPSLLVPAVLQGAALLGTTLSVLAAALARGASPEQARTLAFTTLLAGNLGLIATNRSHSRNLLATLLARNVPAALVTLGSLTFLALALGLRSFHALFHFERVPLREAGAALAAGVASVIWFEAVKAVKVRRRAPRPLTPSPAHHT
jgi:Ca2+-transporting ATPase